MIKKIFFITSLFVLIVNCSGLDFVYNTSFPTSNKINKNTLFSISGDNKDIINSYLLGKIGEAENNPAYVLSIVSNGVIEAAVIKADATASAIKTVANSLNMKGGEQAANLDVAKRYVAEFGNLAKESNTLIIPSDVNNVSSMIATAMSVIDKTKTKK